MRGSLLACSPPSTWKAKRRRGATALGGLLLVLLGADVAYYDEQLPTSLNPLFARTMVDRRSQELVFDRLFYRSAITNELKSRLVTETTRPGDGKTLRLELQPGIKWHDGRSFWAGDVCFTVRALLHPQTASQMARPFREALVGCREVEGQHAVDIELSRVYHNPREQLAFPVLPAHLFDSPAIRPDLAFSSQPVGTGPMRAVRGRQEVQYTAFPNVHHRPSIEAMSLVGTRDPLIQVRTLLNGGAHGIVAVPPPLRPEVAASDDAALKAYDLRSWWYMALDHHHPALRHPKVRQAVEHVIDRTQLRELTVGVSLGDVSPPCELISGPFVQSSPYYNRSVPVREAADRVRARQLMTEAGAQLRSGQWTLDGQLIMLRIGMSAPLDAEATDLLDQVANQLEAAGFATERQLVSAEDWARKAVLGGLRGQHDVLIGKWSFGVVEDVGPLFHTRTADGRGSLNLFDYSNPKVDAAIARFEAARTDTEAQNAYHALHALVAEDLPYIFLWKLDTRSAWRNTVRGNTIAPYYYFTEFDGWRIVPGK